MLQCIATRSPGMLVQCSPTPPLSGERPLKRYISHKKAQPLLSLYFWTLSNDLCLSSSTVDYQHSDTQATAPMVASGWGCAGVVEQLLSFGANACIKEPKNEW